MIKQLFEAHVRVSNLERSMKFYEDVLGLELGFLSEERRIALYYAGGWNKTMFGVWEHPKEEVFSQHLAFELALEDLPQAITDLHGYGIKTRNFAEMETDTPFVFAWMPAAAIYFNDPDGHLLEYIAIIDEPPQPERGIVSLPEWNTVT